MPRKIRATFSAKTNTVEATLPRSWSELDQDELAMVYDYMELYDSDDLRFFLLRNFLGLRFVGGFANNEQKCTIESIGFDGEPEVYVLHLTPEMLAGWMDQLDWVFDPGDVPVRLDTLGGAKAVDAQFHGVNFRTYYMVENYYQGYIMSQNRAAIAMIERLLYPGTHADDEPTDARVLNILNWMVQVKRVFTRNFSNFFKPCSSSEEADAPNMLEVMNCQIRALTGGDVTKEEIINNIDCWRALTELDFKAKEADEFRRQQAKYKK